MSAAQSCVAVLNAGSSSIKFALYEAGRDGLLLFRGQVEGIGVDPHLEARNLAGTTVAERRWARAELDHHRATAEILTLGRELLAGRPLLGVGHRVVHGGTEFAGPVRIDQGIMASLKKLVPLAPLHQPHNLAPIEAIAASQPDLPQVACFDTAFHRSQPPSHRNSPLPRELTAAGVRRYGFHGLSYEFIVARLGEIDPALAQVAAGDRPSRQRRQPVRRRRGAQRRQHHGLHRRRWPDDGHALRRRSTPACCSI